MTRTIRGRRIQKRITEIGPILSQLANNGKIPENEEGIRTLLETLDKVDTALGESSEDIEKLRKQLLKVLPETREDHSVIVEDSVLPGAPVLIKEFSEPVGDFNLLMDLVQLTGPVTSKLLHRIAFDLVKQTGGLLPEIFGVYDFHIASKAEPRIVIKWVLDRTAQLRDLYGIYEAANDYYDQEIQGPKKDHSKGWESVIKYRDAQGDTVSKKNGLYFGPSFHYIHSSCGVTISRQFRIQSECDYLRQQFKQDWITRAIEGMPPNRFEVELREGGENSLSQDNFLCLVVQLAYFLKHGTFINRRALAINIYRALNRVGTEGAEKARPYGLRGVIEAIERVLLLPLQQPDLARHYQFQAESILLAGVPGTGKTLLAKHLMCQDYNAIFASVGSDKLLLDLIDPKGSKILLQIDKIGAVAKLPVVLLVDDIDAVVADKEREKESALISKLLNLLQGVREKGFFLIAATNYPERIDARLLEPGRLSKVVHVPLPDFDDRKGILGIHLERMPFESEEEKASIITKMAKETSDWTGRYLKELTLEAARLCSLDLLKGDIAGSVAEANEPLRLSHFLKAKELILAGVNMNDLKRRDKEIQDFVSQKGGELGFGTGRK